MLLLLALLLLSQNLFALKLGVPMLDGMYENEPNEEVTPQRWLIQQPACSNAEVCTCGAVICCCGTAVCLVPYLAARGNFVEGFVIAALCCIGACKSVGDCIGDVYLGKKRT